MNNIKVILLAPTPPPIGGIAGWTQRMLETKLKNNWTVEVVDEKLIDGREVFGNKNKRKLLSELKRNLLIWKNLILSLRDKNAKVVHSNIPATTTAMLREYINAIITKVFKRKFIIHYRCTVPNLVINKSGKWIFKKLCNISDEVIVLNNISLEFTKKYTRTNISVIPNFIEDNKILDTKRNIKQQVETILYTGGVIKSKGCIEIIETAKKFPDITFKLAGKVGEEINNIELSKNLVLLGVLDKKDLHNELLNADLFMFVSYFSGEGFSNSLLEAMAVGLPCIVSDWAANKDMIENKGGKVVPVKNVNEIINALSKLESDGKVRESQSLWNINKVKNNYSQSIITSMYVDIYDKLSNETIV